MSEDEKKKTKPETWQRWLLQGGDALPEELGPSHEWGALLPSLPAAAKNEFGLRKWCFLFKKTTFSVTSGLLK